MHTHTHKADKIARKEFFRGITYDEMLENLLILLDDEKQESRATVANLPANDDILRLTKAAPTTEEDRFLNINKLCVVVWQEKENKYVWYNGYVKGIDKSTQCHIIDHLERSVKLYDSKWKYPSKEDVQTVEDDQIVHIDVEGEWNISPDCRKRLFSVTNIPLILNAFKMHIQSKFKNVIFFVTVMSRKKSMH